ncbi:hypothetical protein CIG75_18990 [Tumebacillus algifaecis]|uniref:Uncharacterized protein n=1 Tax=Tumebacillus algifaecis TaxID=1214604 RepID=A0A223D5H6_9BACL|nr:hypothetical protein [Tumebacillus algifaecis]ASS76821.1 hypothetical protein CIG75_18990 [Tumebacillus algifaecis]
MAKVVRLKTPQNDVIAGLEYILDLARKGEITSFIFAGKSKDGSVVTAHQNADAYDRQELVAHLQVEVNLAAVEMCLHDQ